MPVACEEFHRLYCSDESGETQRTALRQAMQPHRLRPSSVGRAPAEYPLSPDWKGIGSMTRIFCLRSLSLSTAAFGLWTTAYAQTPPPPDENGSAAAKKDGQARQTPAQQRYGLPQNPILGEPVDIDTGKPLTLERAVRIGLQRQNSIAISKTQTDAASAQLLNARSQYYPQVTPSFRYNYNRQPGGTFFIGGQAITGNAVSENRQDNVVASFLILDTGQRDARVGQARRSAFASEYGLGNERQAVILNVTESYYNFLRTRELARVRDEQVKRAIKNLEAIKTQVAVGNAAQSDTLQAEADLANAEVEQLQAQADLDVAQATLRNVMGVATYDPITPAQETVPPPSPKGEGSLEEYVDLAYANRLDLKQQQERINAQGYSVRLAQLDAGLSFSANIQQGVQLQPNNGETRVFTVNLSYPLFDGFAARSQVNANKANLEAEKRQLDLIQQNIRQNLEQSFKVREQARFRYNASQKAVAAADLNYQAAIARQTNGVATILDVLNAQVQLVTAQVNNVQTVYDFYIADARLQRAIGTNDVEYIPRVPGARSPRVTSLRTNSPSFFAAKKPESAQETPSSTGERKP